MIKSITFLVVQIRVIFALPSLVPPPLVPWAATPVAYTRRSTTAHVHNYRQTDTGASISVWCMYWCLCWCVYVLDRSSGSSVSAGVPASLAPVKRSLSADRQQTCTSASATGQHHHDNQHHQPRPISSPSLSSLQRPSSSLSRKCPRLDVLPVRVNVSMHQSEVHHQDADCTHRTAGTQT